MRLETILAAVVAALVAPSETQGAWSPPLRPAGRATQRRSRSRSTAQVSVGTAWVGTNAGVTSVRAAVGARGHTLLRSRNRAVTGLTVVVSDRGEATVAWMEQRLTGGARAGPIVLRAAFRTRTGRWSPAQRVSRAGTFADAQPRLAVAPDGTVALTLNAGIEAAPGVAVAWRSAGHRFGRLRPVAATGDDVLFEPTLTFDARGRGRLAGIAGCGSAASHGVLLTASGPRRPFRGPRTIAAAPATHLRFAPTARRPGGRRLDRRVVQHRRGPQRSGAEPDASRRAALRPRAARRSGDRESSCWRPRRAAPRTPRGRSTRRGSRKAVVVTSRIAQDGGSVIARGQRRRLERGRVDAARLASRRAPGAVGTRPAAGGRSSGGRGRTGRRRSAPGAREVLDGGCVVGSRSRRSDAGRAWAARQRLAPTPRMNPTWAAAPAPPGPRRRCPRGDELRVGPEAATQDDAAGHGRHADQRDDAGVEARERQRLDLGRLDRRGRGRGRRVGLTGDLLLGLLLVLRLASPEAAASTAAATSSWCVGGVGGAGAGTAAGGGVGAGAGARAPGWAPGQAWSRPEPERASSWCPARTARCRAATRGSPEGSTTRTRTTAAAEHRPRWRALRR